MCHRGRLQTTGPVLRAETHERSGPSRASGGVLPAGHGWPAAGRGSWTRTPAGGAHPPVRATGSAGHTGAARARSDARNRHPPHSGKRVRARHAATPSMAEKAPASAPGASALAPRASRAALHAPPMAKKAPSTAQLDAPEASRSAMRGEKSAIRGDSSATRDRFSAGARVADPVARVAKPIDGAFFAIDAGPCGMHGPKASPATQERPMPAPMSCRGDRTARCCTTMVQCPPIPHRRLLRRNSMP